MNYKLQSSSDITEFYNVDTDLVTCTCPSYIKDHAMFPNDDPRRLCKHLLRIFIEKNILPNCFYFYKEEIERLTQLKRGFHHNKKIQTVIVNERTEAFIPVFEDIKTSWITLFYKNHSYRYNPLTKQWTAQAEPPEKELILKWFKQETEPILSTIDYNKIFGEKPKRKEKPNDFVINLSIKNDSRTPKFKNKEEYEKWKADRLKAASQQSTDKPVNSPQKSTSEKKEKFNIRKIPVWLNVLIGVIGFFILGNILSDLTAKHTILQASLFFLFLCIYPFAYYRLMFPKKVMQIRCPNCKYEGNGIFRMKGSWGIELILWLFFLIPGVIYSLWRGNSRKIVCPKCSFEFVEKLGVVKQY